MLAVVPYALLAIAALATAVVFTIVVVSQLRPLHLLGGAGTFVLLALWFALLTISAGPSPVVPRVEIASILRWLALAISGVWLGWLGLYVRSVMRIAQ